MTSLATVAAQQTSAVQTAASTSVSAALAGTSTAANNALSSLSSNFSTFLNLLMTQLQNQDPTSPVDTNQFTQELVEFSEVEQQINTNTSLGTLIQLTQSGQILQGSGIVGQTVQVSSSQVPLQNSNATIDFTAPAAGTANFTIANSSGAVVDTGTLDVAQGANSWSWNGEGSDGSTEPDGLYTVSLTSPTSGGGGGTTLPFSVVGTASGVVNNNGTIELQMGSLVTPFSNVQAVGASASAATSGAGGN